MTWRVLAAAVVAAARLAAAIAAVTRRPRHDRLADVVARLPRELAGQTARDPDETYTSATIYTYLDGGAEVYLAFGLQGCVARRFDGPAGEIVVDLFEMATSADAFGVYSRDLDGEPVAVGQGGRWRPGWLSAWRGRFFVSVTADRDDSTARDAVLALGRAAAHAIGRDGARPDLLDRLPTQGLDAARVAYLHDHVTLSSHVVLGEANPLGLGRDTAVAVGRYGAGASAPAVLLVRYPDAGRAAGGAAALTRAWGGGSEPARSPDGRWRAVTARDRVAVVVTGFQDEETARARLAEAVAGAGPS